METTNNPEGKKPHRFSGEAGPGRTPGVPQVKRSKHHLDMEHVYKTEREGEEFPGDSPGQATCRALLREDRGKFLTMLNKMRSDHQTRRDRINKVEASKSAKIEDEGSKRVLELIDQLLTEWEDSRAE